MLAVAVAEATVWATTLVALDGLLGTSGFGQGKKENERFRFARACVCVSCLLDFLLCNVIQCNECLRWAERTNERRLQ